MSHFRFRWGISALDDEGGTTIPGFVLKHWAEVGLTRDEFLCVVHLSAYHYESPKGKASPSLITIACEMGYKHKNSVWLLIKSLSDKQMVNLTHNRGAPSTYNFRPFAEACLKIHENTITTHCDTTITTHCDTPSQPIVTEDSKEDKESKTKKYGADCPRPRDLLFDAICEACAVDPVTAGSSAGKVKAILLKANPPYTADEVRAWRATWPAWKDQAPTLWQLKEQIGAVRIKRNGNGKGRVEPDEQMRHDFEEWQRTHANST